MATHIKAVHWLGNQELRVKQEKAGSAICVSCLIRLVDIVFQGLHASKGKGFVKEAAVKRGTSLSFLN